MFPQGIPINQQQLAQILGVSGEGPSTEGSLDYGLLHTREQLRQLILIVNTYETLAKIPSRPDEPGVNGQPTVMVSTKRGQEEADAVIMHASNRIMEIIQDSRRWEPMLPEVVSKARQKIDDFEAETQAQRNRFLLEQEKIQFEQNVNITNAKVELAHVQIQVQKAKDQLELKQLQIQLAQLESGKALPTPIVTPQASDPAASHVEQA